MKDVRFIHSHIAVYESVPDIARPADQTILSGYRQSFGSRRRGFASFLGIRKIGNQAKANYDL
jgi:hypothetical protein